MVMPQYLARLRDKRPELLVARTRDKEEPARGDQRAAIRLHPGDGDTPFAELGEFPQRNTPAIITGIEVDGIEGSPWRFYTRIPIGVGELVPYPAAVRRNIRKRRLLQPHFG